MSDNFKPISEDRTAAGTSTSSAPASVATHVAAPSTSAAETGRALLAGVVGGILSAAGYVVYSRLPDEQKNTLRLQARALLESRLSELRGRFGV